MPYSSNCAALHFRAEENGSVFTQCTSFPPGNLRATAAMVWFSAPSAPESADSAGSGVKSASRRTISLSCMFPVVIVPVLSRQRTSTRARLSTQYRSWQRVRRRASLMELTASAILVSRTSPSGIIPIIAAAVLVTLY